MTAALVNLGADVLLIPRMGEAGAAWGTLIAFALMLIITVSVVLRLRARSEASRGSAKEGARPRQGTASRGGNLAKGDSRHFGVHPGQRLR